jgi:hypothetical protein
LFLPCLCTLEHQGQVILVDSLFNVLEDEAEHRIGFSGVVQLANQRECQVPVVTGGNIDQSVHVFAVPVAQLSHRSRLKIETKMFERVFVVLESVKVLVAFLFVTSDVTQQTVDAFQIGLTSGDYYFSEKWDQRVDVTIV